MVGGCKEGKSATTSGDILMVYQLYHCDRHGDYGVDIHNPDIECPICKQERLYKMITRLALEAEMELRHHPLNMKMETVLLTCPEGDGPCSRDCDTLSCLRNKSRR